MAFSSRRNRVPSPARPRVRGQASPPPPARDVLLSAIARVGAGLAAVADAGAPCDAGLAQTWAAELRVVYKSLRALRLAG